MLNICKYLSIFAHLNNDMKTVKTKKRKESAWNRFKYEHIQVGWTILMLNCMSLLNTLDLEYASVT